MADLPHLPRVKPPGRVVIVQIGHAFVALAAELAQVVPGDAAPERARERPGRRRVQSARRGHGGVVHARDVISV